MSNRLLERIVLEGRGSTVLRNSDQQFRVLISDHWETSRHYLHTSHSVLSLYTERLKIKLAPLFLNNETDNISHTGLCKTETEQKIATKATVTMTTNKHANEYLSKCIKVTSVIGVREVHCSKHGPDPSILCFPSLLLSL
jgi:hypothetical protein